MFPKQAVLPFSFKKGLENVKRSVLDTIGEWVFALSLGVPIVLLAAWSDSREKRRKIREAQEAAEFLARVAEQRRYEHPERLANADKADWYAARAARASRAAKTAFESN